MRVEAPLLQTSQQSDACSVTFITWDAAQSMYRVQSCDDGGMVLRGHSEDATQGK